MLLLKKFVCSSYAIFKVKLCNFFEGRRFNTNFMYEGLGEESYVKQQLELLY